MRRLNKKVILLQAALLILTVSLSAQRIKSPGNTIPSVKLSNGIEMPILGFGTLELNDTIGVNSVAQAIALGYRLFDTATIYGNEEAVGKGIKKSGINREELFITTKLWVSDAGYESTKAAFNRSLQKLGVEYVDLYLIHRPRGDIYGAWKAMEELYEEGKIRAIGVSNFESDQLESLIANAKIKPMVNQIECHPFFQQCNISSNRQKIQ
jgi:2,5-diketo-D-gluconate reductase A